MNRDKLTGILFIFLTLIFIGAAASSDSFFDWIFERHHNQWSWYLRPVFLIPFCYFAYQRSLAGIGITIFCLFTSMFWFPKPVEVDESVIQFLQFEKDWLTGQWNLPKMILALTVPFSLTLLAISFWKRSLLMGLAVVVLMASGKTIWSIYNAGDAGKSILLPAVAGLVLCIGLMFFGFKRLEKKHGEN